MTKVTKYQVRDTNGVVATRTTLRDAVLAAASDDGYGAVFQRDENGAMRLYSSRKHIGNNIYFPAPNEAFSAESSLSDDTLAENDVAEKVLSGGVLLSRHSLEVVVLNFNDEILSDVDGKAVIDIAEEMDISVEDVRKIYQ